MATKQPPFTWDNGFRQPSNESVPWDSPKAAWNTAKNIETNGEDYDDPHAYVTPPAVELVTSPAHNDLGVNVIRHWPTLYDGTNNPHGVPSWWQPQQEVDVLICGAGPSGLAIAISLARQGLSFRIIDKADGPLPAGRADGVQPRFLETVSQWGLANEIHEEGPLIERTAIYKDGKKLLFNRSHQSDSRYRGLHIITQGQIERIYIRDLARHKAIVERSSILGDFQIDNSSTGEVESSYPIRATVHRNQTGQDTVIKAKFLIGSDGAASSVRKALKIPFDGVSTDIYWGIMDCVFDTDYPHAWVFGSVISSKHGGCVIIPREDGYIRLYTQLDISRVGPIAASRLAKDPSLAESGGNVDIRSITPEEVLEQANRIFAPYKLKFAAPLSWFAIWKISERVARTYSSPDMRVHLVGDAAHVHSVMGAFGLNASILDAANIAWKLGLVAKGRARLDTLMSTYSSERRGHAVRIIEVSGRYLRFVCGSDLTLPNLRDTAAMHEDDTHFNSAHKTNGIGTTGDSSDGTSTPGDSSPSDKGLKANANGTNGHSDAAAATNGSKLESNGVNSTGTGGDTQKEDLEFLSSFFKAHGQFLLGVDCPYDESVLSPATVTKQQRAVRVKNGVRAPNPRVCFSPNETGYLYDKFVGPPRFHLVLFASSVTGREVCQQVKTFLAAIADPSGFYHQFGAGKQFNVVVVVKLLPFEWESLKTHSQDMAAIQAALPKEATVVFDDRAPDEDAHTTWGVNHNTGGVAVVRPDLWVSLTAFPKDTERISGFFDSFMV